MNEYIVKKALKRCSAVRSKTGCSDCPYCYRCKDLNREALCIITEQEKEIEQLTQKCNQQAETLAEEQEACVECELEQSWELFARDKEIDRLRAEIERLTEEHNRHKVVVKEFAEKLKIKAIRLSEIENYHVCNLIDELLKEYEK